MNTRRKRTREGPAQAVPTKVGEARRCSATRADGKPCEAPALGGRTTCTFHTPGLRKRCQAGRAAGGRERLRPRPTTPADEPMPDLIDTAAVNRYLGRLIGKVERGLLDARIATAVAGLVNLLQKGLASAEQLERIARLERAVAALPDPEGASVSGELAGLRRAAEGGVQ